MRRILLVAEGTMDRPLVNVVSIVVGVTATVAIGMTIISLGLHIAVTVAALVALLVGVAVLKGRFGGPREFRVEKPADGGPLRITGRFMNGEIPAGKPAELGDVHVQNGSIEFEIRDKSGNRQMIREPAFTEESMHLLAAEIEALRDASEGDVVRRHGSSSSKAIRFYDAKQIVLLRFTEKPSYMLMLWIVSGATVLALLIVGGLLGTV